ncbi:MAG: glycosyltransferase, partial [Ruminococcus sp.]|nr:glycosyltransferase [Ruminococcus sp.]
INHDKTHYYRKPYSVFLLTRMKIRGMLKKDITDLNDKLRHYVLKKQMDYELKHNFNIEERFDVAVSYIQRFSAQFVADYIKADRKIMFFHGSTDEEHELHQRIMANFDKIMCVSKGVQEVLSALYPDYSDKMDYIENYVDINDIEEKSKAFRVDVPSDKLILCSCGRFTTVKGFDIAVDAAKELKDKGVDFVWYFVGDGVERADIEKRINSNNLNDNIIITGMQENPYPYLRCCHIYVQPSREEAHPLSLIEAKILLKPVVTTATVGGKTIINHDISGKIADINANSIADSILSLNNDKQLYQSIVANLKAIDYLEDLIRYKKKWNDLLKG